MKELYMPKMGMVMTDGTVVEWHKNVGDRVTKGENLLSIETDKAVRDIEAPCDGILSEILSAPGDNVPVGTVIAHIDDAAEEEYTEGIVYLEVPPLEYIGEEFEHTVAGKKAFVLLLGVRYHAGKNVKSRVNGGVEALLFDGDDLHDIVALCIKLGVSLVVFAYGDGKYVGKELTVDAEELTVAGCAADYTAQNISASLV